MKVSIGKRDGPPDVGSPALFYVILGVIVLLFAVLLVLKPRGADAKPPRSSRTGVSMPMPLSYGIGA